MLTGRRIAIAVILGITLVFGLAGWRYFTGESRTVAVARTPPPVAAKTPAADAISSASLNQVELSQQLLVDDLQVLQGRVSSQEAEIKRLKDELHALSQRYDALTSFAATPRETKSMLAVEPPKKKRRVVRRPKKR